MAKSKTVYFCQNCGAQHPKWQGQCNSCKEWNTLVEEVISKSQDKTWQDSNTQNNTSKLPKASKLSNISFETEDRIITKDNELNRVLGGGIVKGSLILLGGEPGIGKSTLLLQLCLNLSIKSLYVSGEESSKQIKMRADRIQKTNDNCFILADTSTQHIFNQIKKIEPELVIIDSIQTLHTEMIESSPGSISQIRACTTELIKYAKETNTPVLLIGHINKEGHLAGPKILEHMVDTVLQFEGDQNFIYRIIRVQKNRFGATHELGIYEMQSNGLKQILNPSKILISNQEHDLSGTSIAATLEGMRPLMVEIQALVSSAVYGTPQRSSTGYNAKRLNMILAVLEKRAGFKLGAKDVFLNITGGINIDDPAIDLAVVAAILSSSHDMVLNYRYCFAAEIGLAGEVRPVPRLEQRIAEADKLGFEKMFIAQNTKISKKNYQLEIIKLKSVVDLIKHLF
ncbi:DNA repair protein RadA [Flavobacteriaceae bacterium 14752]|uniref:DNA repair protein RadA n=1 Tax=Mesohalobacter salilacus TaxID=2491711 RepID=UPI000F644164|nr:DNA repair protein RadA [Flavobacteriaceae bacterium 14752]